MDTETHYILRVKMLGSEHYEKREFIGNMTKREIIDLYGLESDNVESYLIEVVGTPLVYGHINRHLGAGQVPHPTM